MNSLVDFFPPLPTVRRAPLNLLVEQQALHLKLLAVLPPVPVVARPALALLPPSPSAASAVPSLMRAHLAHDAVAVAARVVALKVVRFITMRLEERSACSCVQ